MLMTRGLGNPKVNRQFLIYALCIIVALLLLVLLLEMSFENIQRQNIVQETLNSLARTELTIAENTKNLQYLALQIYFDPALRPLSVGKTASSADEIMRCINQLHAYLATFPYLHSVYFYNKIDGVFYTTDAVGVFAADTFFDTAIRGMVEDITSYRARPLVPRMIPSMYSTGQALVYTAFCYDQSAVQLKKHNVVLINVHADYITQHLYRQDQGSARKTFIVDAEGRLVAGLANHALQSDLSEEPTVGAVMRALHSGSLSEGSLILSGEAGKQFVVYRQIQNEGWVMIRSVAYDELFGPIVAIRSYSLLIGFFALMVCAGISAFTSLRVMRPVENMVKSLDRLESEKAAHVQDLQQQYLRLLLHSDMHQRHEEVAMRLTWLEVDIDLDSKYRLFVFLLDNLFGNTDFAAVKRELQLALQSEYGLAEQGISAVRIDAEQDQVVLAVHAAHSSLLAENQYASLRRVKARVAEKTGETVSVLISREAAPPLQLAQVYAETNAMQDMRFLLGTDCLIDVGALPAPAEEYVFPVKEEGCLLAALRQGDSNSALSSYDAIVLDALQTHSVTIVQAALHRLSASIAELWTGAQMDEPNANLWRSLQVCRTVDQVNRLFHHTIRAIAKALRSGLSDRQDAMVAEAVGIIRQKYGDHNLDVTYLADAVRLSPVYFGKLFKRITGETVTAYVQRVRLERAEELLQSSALSINQIADETGFSSISYFSTVFRKKHGVAPNEYRRRHSFVDNH